MTVAPLAPGPDDDRAEPVRILIVEDDFLVASEIEGALAEAGFAIAGVAASADEVLQLAATAPPTLAVMDIRLSGARDGIDAALELFARHKIRCIFATAHHTAATRARAEPARPLAWVPKPYGMPTLVDAVRRAVRELGGAIDRNAAEQAPKLA
jgi:DNA-binding NarL/FixJ family response regulator